MALRRVTLALALASCSAPLALAADIQDPQLVLPPDAAIHRAAVEKIFTDSYAAYK